MPKLDKPGAVWFGLSIVIFLLTAIAWQSYESVERLAHMKASVDHTLKVIVNLEELFSALKDAETASRGYLLTGKKAYLEPYEEARPEIEESIKALHELTVDSSPQEARLKQCQAFVDEKLAIVDETNKRRREQGMQAAMDFVATDRGKIAMDKLRAVIKDMRAEEDRVLKERDASAREATSQAASFSVGLLIAVFVVILGMLVFLLRVVRDVQKANAVAEGLNLSLENKLQELALLNTELGVARDQAQSASSAVVDELPAPQINTEQTILVAEDHAINQQVVQLYLEEIGLSSQVVENGKEALDAVKSNSYSLVLMDCQMPEMDGLTATGAIRRAEALLGRRTPIIAMTAHAMEGDRERCLAAGMDDYISKPLDPKELRQVLVKWLPGEQSADLVEEVTDGDPLVEDRKGIVDTEKMKTYYGPDITRFLQLFVSSAPIEIEQIREGLERRESGRVLRHAHGLKGICGSIFANRMREVCVNIESAIHDDKLSDVNLLLADLDTEFQLVRQISDAECGGK